MWSREGHWCSLEEGKRVELRIADCLSCVEQKAGVKWIGALVVALLLSGFYKRFRWAPVKASKFKYIL
jgi:hypothetical protein